MNKTMKTGAPRIVLNYMVALLCFLLLCIGFLFILLVQHARYTPEKASSVDILDAFDAYVDDSMLSAQEGACAVPKKFWLSGENPVIPVPDPALYGTADSAESLSWLLQDAEVILDGQSTVFSAETVIKPGSQITYYLDKAIFAVTWKQVMDNFVFTISEIKISDPAQFRRYLAGGSYNSGALLPTTEMAQQVNAVVASSADHYRGRKFGIVVYDGEVKRVNKPDSADVCYIDNNGDMIFSYHGQIKDLESAQQFVDENNISFSISFGPILIDNGQRCEPEKYPIGEIDGRYARAALCQVDELHYLIVAANSEGIYCNNQTIESFTDNLMLLGCQKAYTMDGGNSAAIAVNGKLINRTAYGYQRHLSDIIYFCTAVPDSAWQNAS